MSYLRWKKFLDDSIHLFPVELAGRGNRQRVPFYPTFQDAVEDLYEQIEGQIDDAPYAFFGHSMGALLAHELSCMIKQRGQKEPAVIFVSGRWAPHVERTGMVDSTFPEELLKERLLELGGATAELFENKQMADAFIPILKADFLLMESYVYDPTREPLTSAIHVMTGTRDWDVNQQDLIEWRNYTIGECSIHKFKGGHFYIHESMEKIIQHINRILTGYESDLVTH